MTGDDPDGARQLAAIASRYASLIETIDNASNGDAARRRMLIDEVRAALDRSLGQPLHGAEILANTLVVEKVLAKGGFSEILLATHRDLGHRMVVKRLDATRRVEASARSLLLREARTHQACHGTGVLRTHITLRLTTGDPAIVMEYASSGTLADRLQPGAAIAPRQARAWLTGLLEGLATIHASGFVHGDIAPANLLFQESDATSPVISDFGVALPVGARAEDVGVRRAGRTAYAPASQMKGAPADPAFDLHATAIIAERLAEVTEQAAACPRRLRNVAHHLREPGMTAREALEIVGDQHSSD